MTKFYCFTCGNLIRWSVNHGFWFCNCKVGDDAEAIENRSWNER